MHHKSLWMEEPQNIEPKKSMVIKSSGQIQVHGQISKKSQTNLAIQRGPKYGYNAKIYLHGSSDGYQTKNKSLRNQWISSVFFLSLVLN